MSQAVVAERLVTVLARRRIFRDVLELGLVVCAFLLYFAVRGGVADRAGEAAANALDVINLEKSLGIFWELDLQGLILGKDILIQIFNGIYFWLDFPLIAVVGIWMYFRHRHGYTVTRDAILASGAIALVIYYLFPVAPPRLLSEVGVTGFNFLGTVEEYSDLSYQAQSMAAFVNPYAAVPSLHFGWAVLIGAAIIFTNKNWLIRAFGFSLPWLQLGAIVFTANHYILDAFVGLLVCLGGAVIAMMLQRWGYANAKRFVTGMVLRQRSQRRRAVA